MTKSDVLAEKKGIYSIDTSRSIHSRFFKSISILMSVFAFAAAGAACGGSEDKPADMSESDASVSVTDASIPASCRADGTSGTLTDARDNNRTYKTTVINCREWMAENYRRAVGTYYHVDGSAVNDAAYGLLYDWNTAAAQDFCPSGWHLPTADELEGLADYVNQKKTSATAFLAMIARSPAWIEHPNEGGDDFGFAALPAGYCMEDGTCGNIGHTCSFWSATATENVNVNDAYLLAINGFRMNENIQSMGYSVRCIRDN